MKLILITLVAVVVGMMVGCTSSGSNSDSYQREVNTLMQRHIDGFMATVEEVSSMYDSWLSPSGISMSREEGLRELSRILETVGKTEDELTLVASEWSSLIPPSEAETFHDLGYEMMQKRITGIQQTRLMFAEFLRFGVHDQQLGAESEAIFNDADRVWVKLVRESAKLEGVEFNR